MCVEEERARLLVGWKDFQHGTKSKVNNRDTPRILSHARTPTLAHTQMLDWHAESHTARCILHIQGQSSVPHNHSPTNTNVSQLHFQKSLRQVHGQTKRDMKSSLIGEALIR